MNSIASASGVRISITYLEILFKFTSFLFVNSPNPHALAPRHVFQFRHRRFPRRLDLDIGFQILAQASSGGGPQKLPEVITAVAGGGGPHAVTLGESGGHLTGRPGHRHPIIQVVRAIRQAPNVEISDLRQQPAGSFYQLAQLVFFVALLHLMAVFYLHYCLVFLSLVAVDV